MAVQEREGERGRRKGTGEERGSEGGRGRVDERGRERGREGGRGRVEERGRQGESGGEREAGGEWRKEAFIIIQCGHIQLPYSLPSILEVM